MVVLRIVALILIAASLMLLGADAVASLENGSITWRETRDVWALVHEGSIEGVTAWLKDGAPDFLRMPLTFLLDAPAWSVLGILGILLAILFGRRS